MTAMDWRQYDNALGRFNSIDVLSELYGDTSPYAFVLNDPISFSDPTGLCPECEENIKNPTAGQSYTSTGGATYTYNNGTWTQEGGQLSEVIIGPTPKPKTAERNYGGDGSGDAMDSTMMVLDGVNKFNPIANLWDVLAYTFTGEDRLGNKMSVVEASITAVSIVPVVRGVSAPANAVTSTLGRNVVYHSVENGVTQYVGITNNLARRAAQHLAKKGIMINPLMQGLSRSDARAVEQALIEIHGLGKSGGTLRNLINSISRYNPSYSGQLKRGYELLESIGYSY